MVDDGTSTITRTVAMQDAELKAHCKKTARMMDDAWCARLAALHLQHMIETAEDFDKSLVTLSAAQIVEYDNLIREWETNEVRQRRKAG